MTRALAIAVLLHAACLRTTQFHCADDTACGPGGRCEADGLCSVTDGTCTSGHRFGDSAGDLAGTCVATGGSGSDGGVGSDGSGGGGNCSSDYMTISGGNPGHKYKAQQMHAWLFASNDCMGNGANVYLAIPDDAGELAAIAGLAGDNPYWVGIDDMAQEGVYVDVKTQQPHGFLPWAPGEPNNQGNQDCVAGASDTEIETDQCNQFFVSVCECED